MQPVPFNSASNLAPMPFDLRHALLARKLKNLGLPWQPHVGCFVWDPDGYVEAPAPFPERIYFILSLPRFVGIFGSVAAVAERLVWLPTWHQARLLCKEMAIDERRVTEIWQTDPLPPVGEELLELYNLLLEALQTGIAGTAPPA
jgi:hypothetical protein